MRKQHYLPAVLACLLTLTTSLLAANDETAPSLPTDPAIFAHINDSTVSHEMFTFLLKSREHDDMAEMTETTNSNERKAQVTRDIILTTLLAEQARQSNLHQSEQFRLEKELFEQTLLAQLYVQQKIKSVDIDEAMIRQRYAEQPAQTLYRFNIWETADAELAKHALSALQQPGSSLPSGSLNAIETPWLSGTDIDPDVHEQVRPLGVDDFVDAPIYQDGIWKVVQLIDKRSLPRQSYAEEREAIKADMVAEQLDALFESLLSEASIAINEAYTTHPEQP